MSGSSDSVTPVEGKAQSVLSLAAAFVMLFGRSLLCFAFRAACPVFVRRDCSEGRTSQYAQFDHQRSKAVTVDDFDKALARRIFPAAPADVSRVDRHYDVSTSGDYKQYARNQQHDVERIGRFRLRCHECVANLSCNRGSASTADDVAMGVDFTTQGLKLLDGRFRSHFERIAAAEFELGFGLHLFDGHAGMQ